MSNPTSQTSDWRRNPEHRRRRFRRHRRRAFIRSVYSLPSLATLGNALCGFASIYIAGLVASRDWVGAWFSDPNNRFIWAAYLIFLAMVFDGLDGRLARFTRHTTDFGGQLDSLADAISFGAAPAFLAIQLFKTQTSTAEWDLPVFITRLIWAIGALYVSCALIRLARFNVSNQHGEQHHFSFFGLPSPGAAGAVAALVLLHESISLADQPVLKRIVLWMIPVVVLATGLLMVSMIRYAHVVNRYLRGKKSVPMVLVVLAVVLLFIISPTITLAVAVLVYAFSGLFGYLYLKVRRKTGFSPAPPP